ncbi:MAG: transcription termination/antitermination protein NusA, partial [Clostridiales bacterium]|nr:transcription termination/antitermination protein NusA [Clostridiales bacterium]
MNEIVEALKQLEKEKGISQEVIMEAIENSLVAACKRDFGKADNVKVSMDRETAEISV